MTEAKILKIADNGCGCVYLLHFCNKLKKISAKKADSPSSPRNKAPDYPIFFLISPFHLLITFNGEVYIINEMQGSSFESKASSQLVAVNSHEEFMLGICHQEGQPYITYPRRWRKKTIPRPLLANYICIFTPFKITLR